MPWRLLPLLVSIACLGLAVSWAHAHPLFPIPAAIAVVAWAASGLRWRHAWLFVVPALLPVMGFSPWTGWVAIDEFDLLLLATAAGGYAALAVFHGPDDRDPLPGTFRWLLVALVVAAAIGFGRGVADAGGLSWDFFGGYRSSMNSLRIFKSVVFAVLLLPLLRQAFLELGARAGERLAIGTVVGAGVVATAVLWERIAYPGLLDFSTIYRATGPFWEMHVGGAAIDGYLALTVPFVGWTMMRAGGFWRWLLAALLAVLVGYAVLMTFSRGAYMAVVIGLLVLVWLRWRQGRIDTEEASHLSMRARLILGIGLVVAQQLAFMIGGYGGALAVVGLTGVVMLVNSRRTVPWWPRALSVQGGILVAMLLVTETVAVANGGSLLLDRFGGSERDIDGRLSHWRDGIGLLEGPGDVLFGIGMGRLPARFAANGEIEDMPADFRLASVDGRRGAVLFGPERYAELGGLFGIAQRVPILSGEPYIVSLDVWTIAATTLRVSVCEKHLIYWRSCVVGEVQLEPGGRWQHLAIPLTDDRLDAGPWLARRQGVFAISVLDAGRAVAIRNVHLTAAGKQWLGNNDFSAGLALWMLDGSHYFVPWHIDNLLLECLLDGGLVHVLAFFMILVATLRHLLRNCVRCNGMAPVFAASLSGYLVVGIFSSLMDVPRVAVLFFMMLMSVWLLPKKSDARTVAHA